MNVKQLKELLADKHDDHIISLNGSSRDVKTVFESELKVNGHLTKFVNIINDLDYLPYISPNNQQTP